MATETATTTSPSSLIKPLPDVIKGQADWREYRALQLPNGITCMVVHDKESRSTAMAACVQAGAAADPRNLSGLAHFCEHMCFLGSERYPGENDYKKYLAKHGGRSNASTSLHLTTYKFDVLADHAEQAVDIFSQFFVAPLFTPSGTSREVNAVDSENSKNLTDDDRRRWQILKELADPQHYFSKFTTGNAHTLPTTDETQVDGLREALLTFHRKHYRPDNLTVVIVGPQSLDTLQEWIIPRFGPMETRPFPLPPALSNESIAQLEQSIDDAARDVPNYNFTENLAPYQPAFRQDLQQGSWPVVLTVKPLRSMRKLTLLFPLPSVWKVPDQSPVSVLSHLLGHEGPGSSFAVLQNQGWISSLTSGLRVSAPDFSLFQLSVGLTEEGETQWKQVVDLLLAHARLIHQTSVETQANINSSADSSFSAANNSDLYRIWGEVAKLSSIFFQQASPGNAYDFAPSLAQSIVSHGTAACISAGSMLSEQTETFPLDHVIDFSSRLVATNCIIERCSQAAWDEMMEQQNDESSISLPGFGKKTEQWYGIDYFLTPVDPSTAQQWQAQNGPSPLAKSLHLPRPNRYIPRSLDLVPELPDEAKLGPRIDKDTDPPNLILDEGGRRLWHRLDDRYALPKSSLTVLLRNAAVEHTWVDGSWSYDISASVHSTLVASIFSEAMAQETYDADLAGLHWSLSLSTSGILLSFGGFSDRLPDLAIQILQDFLNPSFLKESHFASSKDRMMRNLRSYFESRRADSHALYWRDLLLSSQGSGIDSAIVAAEAASLESVVEHYKRLLLQPPTAVECLFTGNVAESTARDFFDEATKKIDSCRNELVNKASAATESDISWIPGPMERRLLSGEEVELHFASKNLQEENGAVLVTFQSQVPCFKGEGISSEESLKSTAAIRLICHMLREPLFDELRTKQQLGYIINSYYDSGLNVRGPQLAAVNGPLTTPVDLLVVTVLSRKMSPPDVAQRIDEFLHGYRDVLDKIPESELRDHASALSTRLLQPIQKLTTEASMHFAKIQRYGPEIMHQGHRGPEHLPWNSVKTLADAIRNLQRKDMLQAWDQLVHQPQLRSRIVSCVYGTTFPLDTTLLTKRGAGGRVVVVDKQSELLNMRTKLAPYDGCILPKSLIKPSFLTRWMNHPRAATTLGVAAAAVLGAGVVGLVMTNRTKRVGK